MSIDGNDKIKQLALFFLLTIITGYLGLSGFSILLLILPVFSIVIGVKYGKGYNLFNIIAAAIVLTALKGTIYIPLFLIYTVLSLTINTGIDKKEKVSSIIMLGAAYSFLLASVLSIILKVSFDIDISESLKDSLTMSLNTAASELEQAGGYDTSNFRTVLNETVVLIETIFPAILAMSALLLSVVVYGISSYIIRKDNLSYLEPLRLKNFKLNARFSSASIIILIAVFVMGRLDIDIQPALVANLTFILYILVFIQGLGVISFLLDKTRLHRIVKWIILIFIVLNIEISMIISFIGIWDIVFNFRKIKE